MVFPRDLNVAKCSVVTVAVDDSRTFMRSELMLVVVFVVFRSYYCL